MSSLGEFLRERREALRETDRSYSLRQVAQRVGIEPSFLSKVERDEGPPPSEETLRRRLNTPPRNAKDVKKDLPDALVRVLMKSIERDRTLRYSSATQFKEALLKLDLEE